MRRVLGLAAAAFVVCVGTSASAHHSHGQYAETWKDITGVVKEIHFITPHSWVYIEVKEGNGEPRLWALEATNRAGLEKMGIDRNYVKPGDTIKARCNPLRDGTNGCLLGYLKAPDGTVKNWDGGAVPVLEGF